MDGEEENSHSQLQSINHQHIANMVGSSHPHPILNTGAAVRGDSPTPSPRSASISLQAAAAVNAGLQREPSQTAQGNMPQRRTSSSTGRRKSLVLANLHASDPAVPSPGEMVRSSTANTAGTASPQPAAVSPGSFIRIDRDRQPSLGELHQELESEQEAQVNRLLLMIREQQKQLQQLQVAQGQNNSNSQSAIDDSVSVTGAANGPNPLITGPQTTNTIPGSIPRSPSYPRHPRSSFDLARADLQRRSRTPSRGASPRLGAGSITTDGPDVFSLNGRDEVALYQAETNMLHRENQMLRHRIRELERQLSDVHTNTNITHEPSTPSHLLASQSVSEESGSKN